MTTRVAWVASLVLGCLVASPLAAQSVAEERGAGESAMSEREGMNVTQTARLSLGAAERKLAQARKIEEKIAAEADEKKKDKLRSKRDKAYEAAVENFREGLSYDSASAEGWAGLGTAYRELGKYQEALLAHAEGMKNDTEDQQNLAGWTTTLLDGKMFGNAVAAHGQFASEAPAKSQRMLGVMESWLEERRREPGDVGAADLDRLAGWIATQTP